MPLGDFPDALRKIGRMHMGHTVYTFTCTNDMFVFNKINKRLVKTIYIYIYIYQTNNIIKRPLTKKPCTNETPADPLKASTSAG